MGRKPTIVSQLTPEQTQILKDKKKLSGDERKQQVTSYIESLYDPSKSSSLSKMEVLALAMASDKKQQEEYKILFNELQSKVGKRLYKYNINKTRSKCVIRGFT
jgi:hypothetical protein